MSKRLGWSILFVLIIATSARAAMFAVYSDRELVRRSDAIVVGSALTSYTQRAAYGGIETVTPFSLEEVIKGSITSASINVHEPGGRLGDQIKIVPGTPQFEVGERVLLFLKKTPQGTWSATDLVLGKFSFETDRAGQKLLVRQESDVIGFAPDMSRHAESRRSAAKFLEFVRIEAKGGVGVQNYYVEYRPLRLRSNALQPMSNVASTSPKSYTFSSALQPTPTPAEHAASNGFRWTTFPSALTFFHYNTGSSTTLASNTINTAMALWNNDCGSNVNLVNGGADPATPAVPQGLVGNPDGRNTIVWETNLVPFGGTAFSCGSGGTIGLGGLSAASSPGPGPGGETFWTITEGDVDMALNVLGCALFTSSGDFPNGVAHEIGHAMGFRHSDQMRNVGSTACTPSADHECSSSAIMRASLVNGLIGLQEWDINGVRAIYPGPCGVRGDFSGDVKADILLRDSGGSLGMWIMNGPTITSGAFVGSPGGTYTIGGIGDFGGDAKADILLRDSGGSLGLWTMNGPIITAGAFVGSPGGTYTVAGVADFSGDGKADILLRDSLGSLGMWIMNGAVITSGGFVGAPGGSYTVAGTADFSGDGKADILLRDSLGNLGMWIMNGAVITSGGFVGSPGGSYNVAAVADFGGDGKTDILLRDSLGSLGMWIMNGATITSGAFVGSPGGSYTVAAANDYSGDGKADILLRDSGGNLGMWIMNGATITSGAFVGAPGTGYVAY